jgi:hypothetical protein
VPDNFTRKENVWTVSESRWALTHGVDRKGKPRACAEIVPPLTPGKKSVTVTRALCEAFQDRFPQAQRGKARGGRKTAR